MTQKSYLWTTGGAGDGSSTYTRADWLYIAEIIAACHGSEGVGPSYLNACAGSVPGTNTFRIATGGAVVDGKPYHSTANEDVTIPSAIGAGNTRIDRIVLRADWTAQTVRITRIAGTDAAEPTPPSYTKTSQSTYDILLYQVLVDTSGNVSIELDEREFGKVQTAGLEDAAVTAAKIADGACLSEILDDDGAGSNLDADKLDGQHGSYYAPATQGVTNGNSHDHNGGDGAAIPSGGLASGAVTAGKIATGGVSASAQIAAGIVGETQLGTGAVTSGKLGADAVIAGKIADGAVDVTAALANNIVDDTKVGNRVPMLTRRKGGSATDWETAGSSDYTPTAVKIQCGSVSFTISSGNQSGYVNVTFPQAFSYEPIVIACVNGGLALYPLNLIATATSASQAQIIAYREGTTGDDSVYVSWIAIGPE